MYFMLDLSGWFVDHCVFLWNLPCLGEAYWHEATHEGWCSQHIVSLWDGFNIVFSVKEDLDHQEQINLQYLCDIVNNIVQLCHILLYSTYQLLHATFFVFLYVFAIRISLFFHLINSLLDIVLGTWTFWIWREDKFFLDLDFCVTAYQ